MREQLQQLGTYEQQRSLLEPKPVTQRPPVDISVVDESETELWDEAQQDLEGPVGFHGTILSLVLKIQQAAAGHPIRTLHIYDHGIPGNIKLGTVMLSMDSGLDYFVRLGQLKANFAPDGSVVLHNCEVAKGKQGPQLLALMAKYLGVPVTASEDTQYIRPDQSLQGTTVECTPEAGEQWLDQVVATGDHNLQPDCTRTEDGEDGGNWYDFVKFWGG